MTKPNLYAMTAAILIAASAPAQIYPAIDIGIFNGAVVVGNPSRTGPMTYGDGKYVITAGGKNMWATNDEFSFVCRPGSGDISLAANVRFTSTNGTPNPHRKACLMIRQSLSADSAYVDAVIHGNGLTSLQCRETNGGVTTEIEANYGVPSAPTRFQIEKRGNYFIMSIGPDANSLQPSGGSYRVEFKEPFYVGLAVCPHDDTDKKITETAEFTKVELSTPPAYAQPSPTRSRSAIEVVPIPSGDQKVAYYTSDHLEAPNWSHDGKYFIYNKNNRLYKMATNGQPELIDTGACIHINNDHGISPDGAMLAISDQTQPGGSRVYVLPIAGGAPLLLTSNAPSYFHGWSPDGKTLAFCGQRGTNFDIYTIPVQGGQETRLTTDPAKDDGPDYSPDGKYIYFNSDRTGHMQVWRMNPDGSSQEQITQDEYGNVFPHPSPDGRWIVFLSYPPGAQDHPANMDVILRLIPSTGGQIRNLGKMFGGQGTINVSSWSPNSRSVAYVSYIPF